MASLREKKLFLLDMDGTIYLDGALFPGTLPFLEHVKRIGGRTLFLTNNSSRSVEAYAARLAGMGIAVERRDFLTSTDALIAGLKQRSPYRLCYAFGTESFRNQLRESGIPVTDRLSEGIDCLLIGFYTELTFQKLEDACIGGWTSWPPTRTGSAPPGMARYPTAAACARCFSGPQDAAPGSPASRNRRWWSWP